MQLRTLARDCLYVNWALPRAAAPELPEPLRHEVHAHGDEEWVFASALLFRLSGLHLPALPFARLSYPQMNLRLYVLDGDGAPSVLFLRTLVPVWVAPVSRLLGRQPVTASTFSYPSPSDDPGAEAWTWTVGQRRRLEVSGRLASPSAGPGPRLGNWDQTVDFFRNRRHGYAMWENRLRSLRISPQNVEVWPIEAALGEVSLLAESLPEVDAEIWEAPHSVWLCPEIPFIFELDRPITLPLPASSGVPATEGA